METVTHSISRIRNLLITQRSVRLLLRALWTGIAGSLIATGLIDLFNWQADTTMALIAGIVFSLPWFILAFRPIREDKLVWRMDRLLGLREQVTTAWRVAQMDDVNPIEYRLLKDVERMLPMQHKQISNRGWFLKHDLQALLIVVLLLITTAAFKQIEIPLSYPSADPTSLPTLDKPPEFTDVFPSGIPGLTNATPASSGTNPGQSGEQPSDSEIGDINNILSDLGSALSEYPETSDIGDALDNGNLEGAADAIERTADNVDLLPEDARQNMQRALQQAAAQAQQSGQDDLGEDLERAAQALQDSNPNNPLAADALDELADGLRELGETFAAMGQPGQEEGRGIPENEPQVGSAGGEVGAGSGAGTQGLPEPLSRIEGEGRDFTIEGGDAPSGLLQPGSVPGSTITIGGGSIGITDTSNPDKTGTINSILTPYSYPWRWRDVVSEYFSP